MFQRLDVPFSERAFEVLDFSLRLACQVGSDCLEPGHLLVVLAEEGGGHGFRALQSLGIDWRRLCQGLKSAWPPADPAKYHGRAFNLSPAITVLIEAANREAESLNHRFVGTGHLLLGCLVGGDDATAKALSKLGLKPEILRPVVKRLMESRGAICLESPTAAVFGRRIQVTA